FRDLIEPVAVMGREPFRQGASLAECQPKTDHVAAPLGFGEILEAGTRMQDRVVVAKLHVTHLQIHVEVDVRVVRKSVEEIQCKLLYRRQWDAGLLAGR